MKEVRKPKQERKKEVRGEVRGRQGTIKGRFERRFSGKPRDNPFGINNIFLGSAPFSEMYIASYGYITIQI